MNQLKQKITAYLILFALVLGLFVFPINKASFQVRAASVTTITNVIVVNQPMAVPDIQTAKVKAMAFCGISTNESQSLESSLGINTQSYNLLNVPADCLNITPAHIVVQNNLKVTNASNIPDIFVAKQLPVSFGAQLANSSVPVQEPLILASTFVFAFGIVEIGKGKLRAKIYKFHKTLTRLSSLSLSQLQVMRC